MIDIADIRLQHGERYPYNHRPPKDWAERAALGVLADLCDRSGIKHALREPQGDEDISDEIVVSLAAIIRRAQPQDERHADKKEQSES